MSHQQLLFIIMIQNKQVSGLTSRSDDIAKRATQVSKNLVDLWAYPSANMEYYYRDYLPKGRSLMSACIIGGKAFSGTIPR